MPTLLIVDDEELFRDSLATGLAGLDPELTVLTAENGQRAREVIEKAPPDLVLTDLQMPNGDGFELLAWLAQERPALPVMVMTAFGTAEIGQRLSALGCGGFVHKPVDFETLSNHVQAVLSSPATTGLVRGLSLPTFLQVLEMERKTCTLRVRSGGREGFLHVQAGQLDDAELEGTFGEEALGGLLVCQEPEIEILTGTRLPTGRIAQPMQQILLEMFRRHDEAQLERPSPPTGDRRARRTGNRNPTHEETSMSNAQEKLKELASIPGFAGAGVFTPTGESLALVTAGTGFTKEIGALANNVLINSQRASIEMGAGRGQQVHVEAEKAHILVRCLNEGSDPLRSEPGKSHIHLVLALSSDEAIGLAKMRLNTTVAALAGEFRA